MHRLIRVCCAAAALGCPPLLQAGAYIARPGADTAAVVHAPGYTGRGGVLPLRVCLRRDSASPNGDPRAAIRNVVATLNRRQSTVGNVVVDSEQTIDFESMALHEIAHCMGLGHNAIGPSEAAAYGSGDGSLLFANALPGANGVIQTFDGGDGVRGSLDDLRGDDLNLNWFPIGLNDPFAQPGSIVDRHSHSAARNDLPPGHGFAEIASAFAPCRAADADLLATHSSVLRGQPRTQSISYPVLCLPHRIRQLAPEDEVQLRLAGAGHDGVQGSDDDYLVRLSFHDATDGCEIDLRFADGEGFAFCSVEFAPPAANGDQHIRRATATFDRATVWHFSDQTNGGGAGPDLSLTGHATGTVVLPDAPASFVLQISVPAGVTAHEVMLGVEQDSDAGLPFVASEDVACDALPCLLGDLGTGTHVYRLTHHVDAGVAVGSRLQPRFVVIAADNDPDGENNRLQIEVVVADPDPTRILHSSFEAGEPPPS